MLTHQVAKIIKNKEKKIHRKQKNYRERNKSISNKEQFCIRS